MRDFIGERLDTSGQQDVRADVDGADFEAMTEQGFKRFRRRDRRSGSREDAPLMLDPEMEVRGSHSVLDDIVSDEVAALRETPVPTDEPDTAVGLEEPEFTRADLDLPPWEGTGASETDLSDQVQEQPLEEHADTTGAAVEAGPVEADATEFRIQLPAHPPEPWELLRQIPIGVRRHILKDSPLISFFRADPAAQRFDILRTRLLKALKDHGWSRVAIASPTTGCGTTFTAVNLALSLSRVPDTRTVLMDLNHRNPGVAKALDVDDVGDMPGFLAGRVPLDRHMVRCGANLAVGLTAYSDLDASEILHDMMSIEMINKMQLELSPDVVIYDLPAILEYDDAIAFMPQVDGVLIVADGHTTTAEDIAACERLLEGQTQLLGVVLNRGR